MVSGKRSVRENREKWLGQAVGYGSAGKDQIIVYRVAKQRRRLGAKETCWR